MKLALSKASIFLVLLVGCTEIRPTKPVTQESGLAGVWRELLESETDPALEREIIFNDIDGVGAIKSATWLGDKLVALSTGATDKDPVHLLTFTPRTLQLSSSQQILPGERTGAIFSHNDQLFATNDFGSQQLDNDGRAQETWMHPSVGEAALSRNHVRAETITSFVDEHSRPLGFATKPTTWSSVVY